MTITPDHLRHIAPGYWQMWKLAEGDLQRMEHGPVTAADLDAAVRRCAAAKAAWESCVADELRELGVRS